VDAERIEVFHVANSDAVVVGIANDFVLKFLPTLKRLLNQDLRRQGQGPGCHVAELFLVVGETGTQTTQGVGGTDNDGIADLFGGIESLINSADGDGLGNGDVDLLQGLGKKVSIFGNLQSANAGSEDLDAVLLEQTEALHLDTQVQSSLSTKRQEDAVGLLLFDDIANILGGDWQIVDLIGEGVVGLDGSDIRVDEDGRDASLLESLESL
jgi:hypothetical protein